jgi:hypothetical protein
MVTIAPNYLTMKHMFFEYEYQHSFTYNACWLKCGFKIVRSWCFMAFPSSQLNWLDRILANTAIPLRGMGCVRAAARVVSSEDFVYRLNENLGDNVAVLAQRPAREWFGCETNLLPCSTMRSLSSLISRASA